MRYDMISMGLDIGRLLMYMKSVLWFVDMMSTERNL
jgi:hypothetical protein